MTAVIETDRLTKRYGRSRGIDELSLTVGAGEIFGFLGPNGAGKTTTIRTLLDLLHPTSGSARLFGLDSHRDSRAIRARLGNLPGDFAYDEDCTGRELLALFGALRGMDGLGMRRRSRSASRPTCRARCTSSHAGIARRSASSRRSSTNPSW